MPFPELTAAAISLASSWLVTLQNFVLTNIWELVFHVKEKSNWGEGDLEVAAVMISRKGGGEGGETKTKQWTSRRETLANSQC